MERKLRAKYKWEFMRRNQRYIADWVALRDGRTNSRMFEDFWRIRAPIDPSMSWEYLEKEGFASLVDDTICTVTPLNQPRYIRLDIDLSYTPETILETIEWVVRQARKKYMNADIGGVEAKKFVGKTVWGDRKRRPKEYDNYLRVYDLKKEGKSYSQIAKLFFGKENAFEFKQRVRDRYKAAEKLVEDGLPD